MTESAPRLDTSDMPAVHKVFRSSLASAPTFIASAAGNDERRALIANYLRQPDGLPEVHHDGEEQLVFPLLIERAPGAQGARRARPRTNTPTSSGLMESGRRGACQFVGGGRVTPRASGCAVRP